MPENERTSPKSGNEIPSGGYDSTTELELETAMVVQTFQYSIEKPEVSPSSIRTVYDSVHATWPDTVW